MTAPACPRLTVQELIPCSTLLGALLRPQRTLAAGRIEPAGRLLLSEAGLVSSKLDTLRRGRALAVLVLPAIV